MSDVDLQELLAQLHSRLSRAKELDPESRELLQTVAADIQDALAGKATGPQDSTETLHESRLEELAVRFEADHPALAEVLRGITDALAKAGI